MIQKAFFFLVYFTAAFSVFSQKNITKLNISDAALKMYSFSQERAVFKRSSIQLNLKFMPAAELSGAKYTRLWYPDPSRNPFLNTKMSAYSASLEFRVYKKNKPMNGFYWGPWLNIASCKVSTGTFNTSFIIPENGAECHLQIQQDYHASLIGAGLELGIQKKLGKHFTVDWTILGLGINHLNLKGKLNVKTDEGDFDLRQLDMNAFDAHCKLEDYLSVEKTTNRHDIFLSTKAWIPMLRMGIAIGFGY